MDTCLADARIYNLRALPEDDFVPPSDQLITLTIGQLQDLITQAAEKATKPLQGRISSLEDRTASLEKENAALCTKIASLVSTQESEISRICVDIAQDRRRIAALEKVEPQPLQKDRGEILRALLAANGGKMLRSQARKKMHLSESRFSELLATMEDWIEVRPYHLNESWKVLMLR